MIVLDPSFLICGVRIMETRHLSFYMSYLGHLYHLVIWQGGFDSRPGPVCSGLGMILLWAELFYWVYAPTLFIRRRFGPEQRFGPTPWVFVLGLCIGCSPPHHIVKRKKLKYMC